MSTSFDKTMRAVKQRMQGLGPQFSKLYDDLEAYYASEVAQQLTALREQAHLSQVELSRRAHVPQAEVSRILSGRRDARASTLQKLARAMGAELRFVPATSARIVRRRSERPLGKSSQTKRR